MTTKTEATIIHSQEKGARILFYHQVGAVIVSLILHNWFPIFFPNVELYKSFNLK